MYDLTCSFVFVGEERFRARCLEAVVARRCRLKESISGGLKKQQQVLDLFRRFDNVRTVNEWSHSENDKRLHLFKVIYQKNDLSLTKVHSLALSVSGRFHLLRSPSMVLDSSSSRNFFEWLVNVFFVSTH